MTFKNLVDEIQNLSLEDKQSLRELIDKYLIEEKRESIYRNFEDSKSEYEKGKLNFSKDINSLRKKLEE